jgi:hypothetical protein
VSHTPQATGDDVTLGVVCGEERGVRKRAEMESEREREPQQRASTESLNREP